MLLAPLTTQVGTCFHVNIKYIDKVEEAVIEDVSTVKSDVQIPEVWNISSMMPKNAVLSHISKKSRNPSVEILAFELDAKRFLPKLYETLRDDDQFGVVQISHERIENLFLMPVIHELPDELKHYVYRKWDLSKKIILAIAIVKGRFKFLGNLFLVVKLDLLNNFTCSMINR